MILHGHWRATTSYWVRIALNLKGLPYEQVTHDLRTGAQRHENYRALDPQHLVPTLIQDGRTVTQSPAILEWLEERFPSPRLLPSSVDGRARVRAMASLIACDIHPLNNLRVLDVLRREFAADDAAISRWIWIDEGFVALEQLVAQFGDGFAFGSAPTIADCHLIPQVYSAERFGVSMAPFPHLMAVVRRARSMPAFSATDPSRQPDADS